MEEMVLINEAASILNTDAPNARTILKYFKVISQDAPRPEGHHGKPAKLYSKSQVAQVASFVV